VLMAGALALAGCYDNPGGRPFHPAVTTLQASPGCGPGGPIYVGTYCDPSAKPAFEISDFAALGPMPIS
jgi:hypothetical protein